MALVLVVAPVHAQRNETLHGTCVGGGGAVADLGVGPLECPLCRRDAVTGRVQFVAEPVITRVHGRSPAIRLLRRDDVLVAVGGALITTAAGVDSLMALRPGGAVRLTIRRRGAVRTVEYQAGTRCLEDGGDALPVGLVQDARAAHARPEDRNGRSEGFGVTFWCRGACPQQLEGSAGAWAFAVAPEITSVGVGSRAERAGLRIGDAVLTVNGVATDTREGTALFLNLSRVPAAMIQVRRGSQVLTLAVPGAGGRP